MNSKLSKNLTVALKGVCMGAADVIPGVSGGTIAFITGIYEELVESIHNFDRKAFGLFFTGRFREFWKHINGTFLISLICGILLSIFSLAKLMTYLLENHPIQTWSFFFGLIVASSIFILRGISGWKVKDVLLTIFGVGLGAVICTLTPTSTTDALWFIFCCGAIAICAMILPGISGSFILVILGKYDYVLGAVAGLTSFSHAREATSSLATGPMSWGHCLLVIAIFAVGAAIGIVAFSKFLHWLLARWERETTLVLAGFIIGSLIKVWPWHNPVGDAPVIPGVSSAGGDVVFPLADAHMAGAVAFALLGLLLVFGIEFLGKAVSRKKDSR
ncbi:MAG: DUF368 domain-containing protein [Bacteroidia bacterium]|nr:DUF368 domain-containing protein [Bacteroidia bacterium]